MKRRLKHILVKNRYEAEDIQRLLKEGKAFDSLARLYSTCASAPQGGDLGEIDLRRLDPDFAEAAEVLSPGALSPIVKTRFGYHLIQRPSDS